MTGQRETTAVHTRLSRCALEVEDSRAFWARADGPAAVGVPAQQPADVLHATLALASTRAGHPPAGTREDYRGYMNGQFEDQADGGPVKYLPGTRSGHTLSRSRPFMVSRRRARLRGLL